MHIGFALHRATKSW